MTLIAATLAASPTSSGTRRAGDLWEARSRPARARAVSSGTPKARARASRWLFAGKLLQQPAMNNPTLVVVTDRNDLDGQFPDIQRRTRDC